MYVAFIHLFFVAPLLIFVGLTKPQYNWIYYVLLALSIGVLVSFGSKIASQSRTQRTVWYFIHMLLFASLLFYVGWYGTKTPDVAFSLTLAVGLAAFAYHGLRLVQRTFRSVKKV